MISKRIKEIANLIDNKYSLSILVLIMDIWLRWLEKTEIKI